jgi:hypothetical protein
VDVGRQGSHHSGASVQLLCSLRACCASASGLMPPQHRGDMSDASSLPDLMMQISGQFASEYMVYRGLQEEVKKAFASGTFK